MRLSLISACCVLLLVALGSALPVAQPSEALVVEVAPAQEVKSRVVRATADQETAAASDTAPAVDQDASAAEENRDKRFLFGFGGSDGGAGSAGGSGNFLFDIIRLIAGSGTTEEAADASHGTTATGTGGGAVGYSAGAAAIDTSELDAKPDDGYTSGIPGPITRLFVIANRGVSNLIQDLILRLAQTSERIVNFKARLITSII